ncbi:MAG: aldo/keto reductase [Trueperaceae bacterium]|nr:aldo/keto reductase [Trueperaceae bacterium]
MKTYHIPNTDLEVSCLAYGTASMGGSWDSVPASQDIKERANTLIKTAFEQGINHIDMADVYTWGKSDEAVGYALRQNPGLREKLVLQEKAGIILGGNPDFGQPSRYDYSYDHLVKSVEGSLKRLGTDYVDLLAFHRPDPLVELEEIARAADFMQRQGMVRYFGVSNHSSLQIELLRKYLNQPIILNQLELSLLHHHLISRGMMVNQAGHTYANTEETLEYCRLHDIQIQAWSPVAGGKLFNSSQEAPETIRATAALISKLAKEKGTTQEAIALAWLLRHPMGIQPIIGTLNAERIADSALAANVELSRQEWYSLLEAARGAGVP